MFYLIIQQFPEVVGSNPAPATKNLQLVGYAGELFFIFMDFSPCRALARHRKPPAARVEAKFRYAMATRPSRMVIVQVAGPERKVIAMAQKANSLAHTKWLCKYHIVFTPKYRRKAIYNQYRRDLGE